MSQLQSQLQAELAAALKGAEESKARMLAAFSSKMPVGVHSVQVE
jgi:hypothetical protein